MDYKKILEKNNLIPLIIVLSMLITMIITINPKYKISAGKLLYKKYKYGYKPAYRVKRTTKIKIKKLKNNYYKIKSEKPDGMFWIPSYYIKKLDCFPSAIFINANAGKINCSEPPFIKKITSTTYRNKAYNFTFKKTGVYFLFSIFLLLFNLISIKKIFIKNILAVIIGGFLFIYIIFAAGIIKGFH